MMPSYISAVASLPVAGHAGLATSSQTTSSVYVASVAATSWAFSAAKWRAMTSGTAYRPGEPTPEVGSGEGVDIRRTTVLAPDGRRVARAAGTSPSWALAAEL